MKYQYNIELTKYIWNLKKNNIKYNIQWKVSDKVYGNANSAMCKLCLNEKLWQINDIYDIILKSYLLNKFRHLNKFLLKHVKRKQ